MPKTDYSIQSLEAAFKVLESFLNPSGAYRSVGKISELSGYNTNRVFRILNTLASLGYVEQDPQTQKYGLGPGLLVLGEAYRSRLDFRRVAAPFLQELAEASGDAAHLFIRSKDNALCMDIRVGRHAVQASARVGELIPLHIGAAPKILLAFLPETERSKLIGEMELVSYSPKTITDRNVLSSVLEQVRSQGYCVAEEDYELGAYAIGAALRDHTGHVMAAISIAIPQARYTQQLKEHKLALVLDIVHRLSQKLGYHVASQALH